MKTLITIIKAPFILASVLLLSLFLCILWLIGAPIKVKIGKEERTYRWFWRLR